MRGLSTDQAAHAERSSWPVGGGEMGARMRAKDWSATPLGEPRTWSQSIKVALSICLNSRFPIVLWLGPELRLVYNDSFIPLLGEAKHPKVLGASGREAWGEIWSTINPMLEEVRAGRATSVDHLQMFFARRLPREEAYVTFDFSPIVGADGRTVEGVFCACTEKTGRIIGERRLATLRDLGSRSPNERTTEVACRDAAEVPRGDLFDIPLDHRSTGKSVGMLSTVFRGPYHPSASDLRLTDLYAGQAANVIASRLTGQHRLDGEARLKAAVDLLGLGCYWWNPQTDELIWDDAVRAIWGLPPGAPVDRDVWRAGVHPNDIARVEQAVRQCTDPQGDGAYRIEYRVIRRHDGAERWVSTFGRTSFDKGKPVGFNGAVLDITDRKHGEEALRQSELRLAAILEQLPVGVGLFDHEGRLQQANTLLRRFIDGELLPSKDPQAGARWRALRADGRPVERSAYPGTRALGGEPVVPGIDFLHRLEDGREIWVRVSAAPFRDEAGRITGIVEVVQDVDQEKRAAQANLLLIAELHHRTRNLLAVVSSLVEETVGSCSSIDGFAITLRSRLAALSRVQSLLSREDNRAVTIGELVRLELRALGAEPDGDRVAAAGPEAALPRRSIQILALALHELGTNARKHGALRTPEGHLAVTWVVRIVDSRRRLTLHWHESRIAERANAEPARRGFGRVLIEELLPLQLDAETHLAFSEGELHCFVTMAI